MTYANVLVGLGKIVKGWRRCGYLCRSAKGATVDADRLGSHVKDFNPRSREGSDSRKSTRKPASRYFNPRSGAARHIALHELLGTQYACQEDHFELQQTAENISQIL